MIWRALRTSEAECANWIFLTVSTIVVEFVAPSYLFPYCGAVLLGVSSSI